MKLITRQSKANKVAQKWKESYFHPVAKHWQYGATKKEEIYNALVALGKTPNIYEVNKIIGNGTWTKQEACDECGESFDKVVRFGRYDKPESHQPQMCLSCLQKAVSLLSLEN